MDIFESLENLNVSEECFDDIMDIVEEYINELKNSTVEKTLDAHWDRITNNKARGKDNPEDTEKYFKSTDRAEERARKKGQVLSKTDKGKHVHSKLAFDNGVLHYVRANESLYNEILNIVEEIVNEYDNLYSHIVKFSPEVTAKHLQKFEARNKANGEEIKAAATRELGDASQDNLNKIYSKRYDNKNTKGNHKTKLGQMKYSDGIIREKSLKQAIEASIARNKAKQEKKNK